MARSIRLVGRWFRGAARKAGVIGNRHGHGKPAAARPGAGSRDREAGAPSER